MIRLACICVVVMAAALALAAPPAAAQQAQTGCLAAGTCGTKGNAPGPRRDYWYNWVCRGCHTGAHANLAPSPQELALIQVPARFWTMHEEAARNGETRMRARRHGLMPPAKMAAPFRQLLARRPAKK